MASLDGLVKVSPASRAGNNSKITKLVYLKFNKSLAEHCRRDWNQPIVKALASVPVGN